MCEIIAQFAENDEKQYVLTEEATENLGQSVLSSATGNPDAWGMMSEGITFRTGETFCQKDIDFLKRTVPQLPYVIFHTRKGTSGGGGTMSAHPFTYKGFRLVHNGVSTTLANDSEAGIVDSQALLHRIVECDEDTIVESIKEVIGNNRGSFSVFLETPEGNIYYFRNKPSMYFAEGESSLFAATAKCRLTALPYDLDVESVPKNTIFEIDGKEYEKVGEIPTTVYSGGRYGRWNRGGRGRKVDTEEHADGCECYACKDSAPSAKTNQDEHPEDCYCWVCQNPRYNRSNSSSEDCVTEHVDECMCSSCKGRAPSSYQRGKDEQHHDECRCWMCQSTVDYPKRTGWSRGGKRKK